MDITIGSARCDENGKYCGGKVGDQTGKEVSTQKFYVSSKGWYILRPKSISHANLLANKMLQACNNKNIGYAIGKQNPKKPICYFSNGYKLIYEIQINNLYCYKF